MSISYDDNNYTSGTSQLCADTGCSLDDLLEAMDDREGWRERVRDIRAESATRWY